MSDLVAKARIHDVFPPRSLEHLLDLLEIGVSDVFFPLGSFLPGGQDHGVRWQGQDLIEWRLIGDKRPLDQSCSGLPQGAKIDLQKAGDAVVVIEAQSVSIRNGDQKKIEKDFQGRKVPQKSSCDKPMIDPAEGAFNLSYPSGKQNSFDLHSDHPPVWMILFCSKGIDLAI